MKLPNGYGSVSKVDRKNLRNKWIARVTVETTIDDQGKKHQKKKTIGYFATQAEALKALTDYNERKADVNIAYKDLLFSGITLLVCGAGVIIYEIKKKNKK